MTIERLFNKDKLEKLCEPYRHFMDGFYPETWVEDHTNVALLDTETDDLGLFEFESEKMCYGHYVFKSRGKEAISRASSILSHLFELNPETVVVGMVFDDRPDVKWMTRKLGFQSIGKVASSIEEVEIFTMTRLQGAQNE